MADEHSSGGGETGLLSEAQVMLAVEDSQSSTLRKESSPITGETTTQPSSMSPAKESPSQRRRRRHHGQIPDSSSKRRVSPPQSPSRSSSSSSWAPQVPNPLDTTELQQLDDYDDHRGPSSSRVSPISGPHRRQPTSDLFSHLRSVGGITEEGSVSRTMSVSRNGVLTTLVAHSSPKLGTTFGESIATSADGSSLLVRGTSRPSDGAFGERRNSLSSGYGGSTIVDQSSGGGANGGGGCPTDDDFCRSQSLAMYAVSRMRETQTERELCGETLRQITVRYLEERKRGNIDQMHYLQQPQQSEHRDSSATTEGDSRRRGSSSDRCHQNDSAAAVDATEEDFLVSAPMGAISAAIAHPIHSGHRNDKVNEGDERGMVEDGMMSGSSAALPRRHPGLTTPSVGTHSLDSVTNNLDSVKHWGGQSQEPFSLSARPFGSATNVTSGGMSFYSGNNHNHNHNNNDNVLHTTVIPYTESVHPHRKWYSVSRVIDYLMHKSIFGRLMIMVLCWTPVMNYAKDIFVAVHLVWHENYLFFGITMLITFISLRLLVFLRITDDDGITIPKLLLYAIPGSMYTDSGMDSKTDWAVCCVSECLVLLGTPVMPLYLCYLAMMKSVSLLCPQFFSRYISDPRENGNNVYDDNFYAMALGHGDGRRDTQPIPDDNDHHNNNDDNDTSADHLNHHQSSPFLPGTKTESTPVRTSSSPTRQASNISAAAKDDGRRRDATGNAVSKENVITTTTSYSDGASISKGGNFENPYLLVYTVVEFFFQALPQLIVQSYLYFHEMHVKRRNERDINLWVFILAWSVTGLVSMRLFCILWWNWRLIFKLSFKRRHSAEVSVVRYHPHLDRLASGSWDFTVLVYNQISDMIKAKRVINHDFNVNDLCFCNSFRFEQYCGRSLMAVAGQGCDIWDWTTGERLFQYPKKLYKRDAIGKKKRLRTKDVKACEFTKDDTRIVFCMGRTLYVYQVCDPTSDAFQSEYNREEGVPMYLMSKRRSTSDRSSVSSVGDAKENAEEKHIINESNKRKKEQINNNNDENDVESGLDNNNLNNQNKNVTFDPAMTTTMTNPTTTDGMSNKKSVGSRASSLFRGAPSLASSNYPNHSGIHASHLRKGDRLLKIQCSRRSDNLKVSPTIMCLSVSPDDSRYVAVGLYHGRIEIYNLNNGDLFAFCDEHSGPVNCLSYDRTGRYLVSGSGDNTVRVFDVYSNMRCVRTFLKHNNEVLSLKVDVTNRFVCTGGRDEMIYAFWLNDLEDPSILLKKEQEQYQRMKNNTHHSSSNVVIEDSDMQCKLICEWNVRSVVNSLDFSTFNEFIACGTEDNSVVLFQLPEMMSKYS